MSDEIIESQVVKDTKSFDEWFKGNISQLMVKAREVGLEGRMKEIMRMAWRKCCEHKNKEMMEHLEYIKLLKSDIDQKQKKYDELHMELQKVTNKLIQAEKNAKK